MIGFWVVVMLIFAILLWSSWDGGDGDFFA